MYEFLSLHWFDVPLVYSDHALMRADERNLPIYPYLPITAHCIRHRKRDDVYTFQFQDNDFYVVLVLNKSGRVLTTYCRGIAISKVAENVKLKRKKVIKGKAKLYSFDKYPSLEIQSQLFDYA